MRKRYSFLVFALLLLETSFIRGMEQPPTLEELQTAVNRDGQTIEALLRDTAPFLQDRGGDNPFTRFVEQIQQRDGVIRELRHTQEELQQALGGAEVSRDDLARRLREVRQEIQRLTQQGHQADQHQLTGLRAEEQMLQEADTLAANDDRQPQQEARLSQLALQLTIRQLQNECTGYARAATQLHTQNITLIERLTALQRQLNGGDQRLQQLAQAALQDLGIQ